MRKWWMVAAVVSVLTGAYAASPLVAAWQIREAVRTGDSKVLTTRVDWHSVRRSLKSSLSETRLALTELSGAVGGERPGLWQRMKAAALPYLSDPLIERYVTAEGAPRLYAWRQTWRQRVRPSLRLADPVTPLSGTWLSGTSADRSLALARRLHRLGFTSPGCFRIELADSYRPGRRWLATLELKDFAWQLTGMQVLATPGPPRALAASR